MPQRTLSEVEFNTLREHVLAAAPSGLDETNFNRFIGPAMARAIGEAESSPAKAEGAALTRFAAGAWQNLNPVAIATGVYGAVRHPVDTATNIANASIAQGRQAVDLAKQGRYSEAVGHGLAVLPVIGPAAAAAGEAIGSGDVAGGLGQAAGLLAPIELPRAAKAAGKAVRMLPEGVAAAAEAGAASRVVDVMAPKIGANKTRFGGMAEKVAPQIAKDLTADGAPLSRQGLHVQLQGKLHAAEEALDAAHDARFKADAFPTQPIIKDLLAKRQALTAEAVRGSEFPRTAVSRQSAILDPHGNPITVTDLKAKPIGSDVVPAPNNPRVAQIDRAIKEVKALGPMARYDALRTIRMSYDGPAKAIYSPSMTADYVTAQGGKLGAADVTGVLRDNLAKFDPAIAKANAPYALYRTANDVLEATAEVERTRPKVGRIIAARVLGTTLGQNAAGVVGAVGGYALAPVLDAAMSSGMTTKLVTAKMMTNLAKAIRGGNLNAVTSLTAQLRRLGTTAAAVQGNATSPSGSRTQTTAPAVP